MAGHVNLERFEAPDEVRIFVTAVPHDSWVVGDRPYISLHLMEADSYARK